MPNGELISVTINDGIKKFSELGRHDNSNEDKSKYKKVCIGDIAYNSMRMWQGASGYSPYNGIVSPAYTVLLANEGVNSKCIAYQFKLPGMIHAFQINSQGITSDNWNLKFQALSDITIYISRSIDEQGKIAVLLESLDHLITLHQRKLEKLKIIKKSMLENLFPQNGEKTPKIRFSGFTKDWEQRKLGEIVGIYDGVHQTPKYQDNGIMFLSVENIATLQSTKYISEDNFKRDYKVYPQENDILMTRIGDVGTTNVIADKCLKAYYVSLALLKYKSTNPYFLSNAIQSGYVKKELANRTLKTAIPMKINKDEIGKVDVMLPISVQEQNKIGEYFRNIDHLITLHQSKSLGHILKTIASRTLYWEQRKLGEMYTQLVERNIELLPFKKILSVSTMTYKGDGNGAAEESLSSYKRLRVGDIAFEGHTSKDFRYGRFVLNDTGDGIMSPRFSALRPISVMPIKFWKYYIHYEPIMKKILVNSTKSGTMMNELVVEEFLNELLLVPEEFEQQKIGRFFNGIDHFITLHQLEPFQLIFKAIAYRIIDYAKSKPLNITK